MTESQLQTMCVQWFRLTYRKYADLLYAIPNGGQRHILVAKKLKREGVLSGVPDLCLALPNRLWHGCYIELKVGKNKPTDNQKAMLHALFSQGYFVNVCWTFEEFEHTIKEYMRDV